MTDQDVQDWLLDSDPVFARDGNRVLELRAPTAHAEMLVIRAAARRRSRRRRRA